jgi:hypothetical protein
VGTWTSDTIAVSSSASAASSAARSICPCSSSSTSTSWHPVRRWSWSRAMALAPYSARLMSTRSCGAIGSEYTAMSQARVDESISAISVDCAPMRSARAA